MTLLLLAVLLIWILFSRDWGNKDKVKLSDKCFVCGEMVKEEDAIIFTQRTGDIPPQISYAKVHSQCKLPKEILSGEVDIK